MQHSGFRLLGGWGGFKQALTAIFLAVFCLSSLIPLQVFAQENTPGSGEGGTAQTDPVNVTDSPEPAAQTEPAVGTSDTDAEILGDSTQQLPTTETAQGPTSEEPVEPATEEEAQLGTEIAPEEDSLTGSSVQASEPPSGNLVSASGKSGFGVDSYTGRLTYELSLAVPPGRGTTHPGLSLVYDSHEDSNTSIAGFGWNVDIPYIIRTNKNGVEKMYATSTFASSFDRELATTSDPGIYGAKVERGDFIRSYP